MGEVEEQDFKRIEKELSSTLIDLNTTLGAYDNSEMYKAFGFSESMREGAVASHNEMRHALYHFFLFVNAYYKGKVLLDESDKILRHVEHALEFALSQKLAFFSKILSKIDENYNLEQKFVENQLGRTLCEQARAVVSWEKARNEDNICLLEQSERKAYYQKLRYMICEAENFAKSWRANRMQSLIRYKKIVKCILGFMLLVIFGLIVVKKADAFFPLDILDKKL